MLSCHLKSKFLAEGVDPCMTVILSQGTLAQVTVLHSCAARLESRRRGQGEGVDFGVAGSASPLCLLGWCPADKNLECRQSSFFLLS